MGQSKIATINDRTDQMTVYIDGRKDRTIPVAMGRDQVITVDGLDISFITHSGTYVAQEKYRVKEMRSASYGLPANSALGCDAQIPLAVRRSDGGIFVHSAPWSVADQGVRNVSYGCLNINPVAAQWFYNIFSYVDVVTVAGAQTQLDSHDGFGDWNISWANWLAGSGLRCGIRAAPTRTSQIELLGSIVERCRSSDPSHLLVPGRALPHSGAGGPTGG